MDRSIFFYIQQEAHKSRQKFEEYHNNLHVEYERKLARLNHVPPKEVKRPEEWQSDCKHNPYYVLRNLKSISKSITKKIKSGSYVPHTPFNKQIPKKGGGWRTVSIYQLPDSAVSDKYYHDLLRKNKHRFSSFAYAYRNDRNVHFAIQDIANELRKSPRIFVAEFDFRDFFGSISHEYLLKQLNQNCFIINPTEKRIISAFLVGRDKGIPQGTSISLFLANMVCWELDRRFEDEGLRFARYADDTIIWTRDYSKICKAFEIINEFSDLCGVQINYNKSDGISLLQKQGMRSEFENSKSFIEFLGYKVSVDSIGIKNSSVLKIKRQISYILYKNLIQPIRTLPITASHLPQANFDRDYLSAIMQIRRYLYGNLSEHTLQKYLNGSYVKLTFKGVMSFYPLIDDEAQMKLLDKWLISTILNVLRKRKRLLKSNVNLDALTFPYNLTGANIIKNSKSHTVHGKEGLFQIPSFMRIYLAIRKGVGNLGIEKMINPNSTYYEG